MKFDIPKNCHIRWQAALAVLQDLQEDIKTPFDMGKWSDRKTQWEGYCGTAACFGGYITIAPYCRALGSPTVGQQVKQWLLGVNEDTINIGLWKLDDELFDFEINAGSRAKTLAFLEKKLKSIFKESTGKRLIAPLTFYVD